MTDYAALAEAIERDRESGSPGPWRTHDVDDTSVIGPDGTDVATTCDSSQAERDDAYNVEYERMEADARRIARLPDLEAAYLELWARVQALEWQPMRTSPADGSRVLLYLPKYGPFTGHWDKGWHVYGAKHLHVSPIRWMPLPTKPPETDR